MNSSLRRLSGGALAAIGFGLYISHAPVDAQSSSAAAAAPVVTSAAASPEEIRRFTPPQPVTVSGWTVAASYPAVLESPAVASNGVYVFSAGGRLSSAASTGFYRYDPVFNSWSTLAPLPTAVYATRAVWAANTNKIYVFGGVATGGTNLATTQVYDIATNSWSAGAAMPAARFFPNLAYSPVTGKIYVIGGLLSGTEMGQTWEYDPVANSWSTTRASAPGPIDGSATSISGQYIYMVGRFNSGAASNIHYRYDITNDAWATMAPAPVPVYVPFGEAVGGETYLVGGGNTFAPGTGAADHAGGAGPAASYNSTYIYNIATNTWTTGPNTNSAHSFTDGAAVGNQLVIVAGYNGSADTNVVERATATPPLAPPACTTSNWNNVASYPLSVYGAAAATDGRYVYGFGGNTIGGAVHAESYRYDPAANSWSPIASLAAADYLFHAEYANNGKIYVMGGLTNGTANRIYDVASNTWSTGAAVPAAVYDHGHAFVDGTIYVIGGITGGVASNAVYAYNVAANSWTTKATLPVAEFNMAAGVIGGKIYIAGGSTGSNQVSNVYIYDIAGNSWSAGAPLPLATNFPSGAVVAGKLWVNGGGNPFGPAAEPASPESFANTQIYDPVANSWSSGPNLQETRSFADAVTLNGGQTPIVVAGYTSSGATSITNVESATVSCDGGLVVGSSLTIGYGPNNYSYLAANTVAYTFANGRAAPNEFAIFQTHDPWGATVIKSAITSAVHDYDVFTPAQLSTVDLNSYRVVVLNWDDTSTADFMPAFANARGALETYVRNGGVLWVQAAIQGATGEGLTLPFGVQETKKFVFSAFVTDPGNPMVAGAPNPITGGAATHGIFTGVPGGPGGHVIARDTDANGQPVLFEFRVRRVPYDTNHDLRTDRTIFRPTAGAWYLLDSSGAGFVGWGTTGDYDVMADYDGDGVGDIAVFRPSNGTWYIIQSRNGVVRTVAWGVNGDIPLAGDVDGDGKADLVIFRPTSGAWYVNRSGGGTSSFVWGINGDIPLLGDFDGDRYADLVIFRPSSGVWYIPLSSGGISVTSWGTNGDVPVIGSFDGDAKADWAVFRPSTGQWYVLKSSGGTMALTWGTNGDIPVSGDFDGDGRGDFTIFRPTGGGWYTQYATGGSAVAIWGTSGDKPTGRQPGT